MLYIYVCLLIGEQGRGGLPLIIDKKTGWIHDAIKNFLSSTVITTLQGYLVHKKSPPPLRPP